MKKEERIKIISKVLDELYPHPKIPLKHKDTYTLLIAVLLSAQCTDARVNLVTPELFAKADTPEEMVKLNPKEIQAIIRPCGLSPTKSKAIWNLSRMIIEDFDGEVPKTMEELETLPGVGHKTASVVMVQAYGKPAFPVDTHIHRCAKRWGLSKAKNVKETERDLQKAFAEKTWAKKHLQIIYFAREHCKAVKHKEDQCPICRLL